MPNKKVWHSTSAIAAHLQGCHEAAVAQSETPDARPTPSAARRLRKKRSKLAKLAAEEAMPPDAGCTAQPAVDGVPALEPMSSWGTPASWPRPPSIEGQASQATLDRLLGEFISMAHAKPRPSPTFPKAGDELAEQSEASSTSYPDQKQQQQRQQCDGTGCPTDGMVFDPLSESWNTDDSYDHPRSFSKAIACYHVFFVACIFPIAN
eukprot:TRINITY_DN37006_c0_g1_i1.p1 TRINITY_DN37006_c0_g1~~TRINITY_DN37006_c0_g1_i1.p1  ORF type:complete len:207 (-),score=38.64 TRINITY_DN37006_c0_g1_i1:163-783(-)